jgi:hypothetical protein
VGFIDWVENSALGLWMVDSIWAYPIVLSMHAVGMAIVVGTVIMVDLRLRGFARDTPPGALKNMFTVTWFGVALNFLSGVGCLLTTRPSFCITLYSGSRLD